MRVVDVKNAKPIVIAQDNAPSAAGYGAAQAVKLPAPGLYVVDVNVPVFLRDGAQDGDRLRTAGAAGTVPVEVRIVPGALAWAYPLQLSADVLVSAEDGREARITFIPLVEACT